MIERWIDEKCKKLTEKMPNMRWFLIFDRYGTFLESPKRNVVVDILVIGAPNPANSPNKTIQAHSIMAWRSVWGPRYATPHRLPSLFFFTVDKSAIHVNGHAIGCLRAIVAPSVPRAWPLSAVYLLLSFARQQLLQAGCGRAVQLSAAMAVLLLVLAFVLAFIPGQVL